MASTKRKETLARARAWMANLQVDVPIAPEYGNENLRVDLASVRGRSAAGRLAGTIATAAETQHTCQLLTGFSGSGKSTELYALRQLLQADGYRVHYLDVDDYIAQGDPLEPDDVLLALGAALYDANLGRHLFREYLGRVWNVLNARISVPGAEAGAELGVGGAAKAEATFSVAFQQDPELLSEIKEAVRKERGSVLKAVKRMVTLLQQGAAGRVVLLVDSLEHASPRSGDLGPWAEQLRQTVIEDGSLQQLPIHVVYTVSPLILTFVQGAGQGYSGELRMVPAVRVVDHDGTEHTEGVDRLVEVLKKRIPLDEVFAGGEADARTAVRASGGYLRDLFRLTREAILEGLDGDGEGAYPIPSQRLEGVVDRLASQTANALTVENCAILSRVVAKPAPLIPSESERRLLYELYREPLLLRYLNDEYADLAHPFVLHTLDPKEYRRRVFPEGRFRAAS